MQKNVAGQKIRLFAFNRSSSIPVTGDAANITCDIAIDHGSPTASATTNPVETEQGYYLLSLTQAETNGDVLDFYPVSATSSVQVVGVPSTVYTFPASFASFTTPLTAIQVEDAIWDAAASDHNTSATTGALLNILSAVASAATAGTLDTNTTPLLTVDEFKKRGDYRLLAQLLSDTDTAVSSSALSSDDNLQALLMDATGMIESACAVGERYTASSLAALTGAAKAFMERLVFRLTVCFAYERRLERNAAELPYYKDVMDILDKLATGERILPFVTVEEAGIMSAEYDTRDIIDNKRKTTASWAQRFFGERINRRE